MRDIYEWVKFYAEKGFSIIPASPDKKAPIIKWKRYQESPPNPKELEKWFKGKKPSEVMIFLAMGVSGYFALDFDKPELLSLFFDETIEELAEKTWVSKTPKGYHILFRYKGRIESKELPGVVELKAKGKGIIAPPSKRSDRGIYQWITNIKKVEIASVDKQTVNKWMKTIDKLREHHKLIEILVELWKEGIRHNEALSIAGILRKARVRKVDAIWIIKSVCRIKRDPEIEDRVRAVDDTWNKPITEIAGTSILRQLLIQRLGRKEAEEIIAKIKEAIGVERTAKLEESEIIETIHKVSGKSEIGYFETIEHGGRLCFLVYDGEEFRIVNEIQEGDEKILPFPKEMFPYEPYGYFDGEVDPRKLADEIKEEFGKFVDADEESKIRWTIETLHSYITDLQPTTPYEFLFGDEECGKTQTASLFSKLLYRPLFGQKLTAPNVYTYLYHHPNATIILDNAEDLDRDRDLADAFREGYKKGAKIPRIIESTSGERKQVFYPCYGFKVCASRRILRDSNLMGRFIPTNMYEGQPEKDEYTEEDFERFRKIRDKLLKWRMISLFEGIEDLDVETKGRLKELWKPLLRVAKAIGWGYDSLIKQMRERELDKMEKRRMDVNSAITRCVLVAIGMQGDDWITNETIWEALGNAVEGDYDERRRGMYISDDYGEISKQLIGKRLESLFGSKPSIRKIGGKTQRCYRFSLDRVLRVVKRYLCDRVTELRIKNTGEDNNEEESHLVLICPYHVGNAENDCSLYVSCPIGSIRNYVTVASLEELIDKTNDDRELEVREEELDVVEFRKEDKEEEDE